MTNELPDSIPQKLLSGSRATAELIREKNDRKEICGELLRASLISQAQTLLEIEPELSPKYKSICAAEREEYKNLLDALPPFPEEVMV